MKGCDLSNTTRRVVKGCDSIRASHPASMHSASQWGLHRQFGSRRAGSIYSYCCFLVHCSYLVVAVYCKLIFGMCTASSGRQAVLAVELSSSSAVL